MEYPNLSSISTNSSIAGLMALPNSSFPYFWSSIIFAIWTVLTLSMYFKEKETRTIGNFLSSASVASFACAVLVTLGSLFDIFTVLTLIPILVLEVVVITIWIIFR